jgi:acyl carrier protein
MTEQELTDRVIAIITTNQKLPAGTVNAGSTFQELGIDSLDGIKLLFAFEEEFQVSIPDETARQMTSVGQIVESLRQVIEQRETPAASGAAPSA